MPWLQMVLDTETSQVNQISEALTALGALSVTWQDAADQPLYEPPLNSTPLWEYTRVIGLFEEDRDGELLKTQLQTILAPLPLPPCQLHILADQEWTRVWMDDFHARQFGQRLWVCPSWESPPAPQAVNIFLDPGLAFGTGTHTTTALCLEWLEQQTDLPGKTLIDYGCGSGILAIAAIKLGATRVWAIDNDPQALRATTANATNNQVENQILAIFPEQLPALQADGLLANILALPLISLAATFASYLKMGSGIVLSGILKEQANEVITSYQSYFAIQEIVERDNWMRIIAVKN